MGYPTSLKASVYTKKIQVTSGIFMLYHCKACHNYFIPSHRKYRGQHNQWDIPVAKDMKVGCNTIEYTTTFLYSDWLYFL